MIRTREYFFDGPEGNEGYKFRTANRPPESTFRDLLDSIWFKGDNLAGNFDGVFARREIDSMKDIYETDKESGIYWGTDIELAPVDTQVMIMAWKDNQLNYTFLLTEIETGTVHTGHRKMNEDVLWNNTTIYPYATYGDINPVDLTPPADGYYSGAYGNRLWLLNANGSIFWFSGGDEGSSPGKKKPYEFHAIEGMDRYDLDEEVVDPDVFFNGIVAKKEMYSYHDVTINFTIALKENDFVKIINTIQ